MYIGHEGDKLPPIEYDYDYNYKSYYLIVPESSADSADELIDKICLEFKCIKDNIDIIELNERYLKDTTKAYLVEKDKNYTTFNFK